MQSDIVLTTTDTKNHHHSINQRPQVLDLESGIEWHERRLQRLLRRQQQQQQKQQSSPNYHYEQNSYRWKKQSLPISASFPFCSPYISNDNQQQQQQHHHHHLCHYYNYSFHHRKRKLSLSNGYLQYGWNNNTNNVQSIQKTQSTSSSSSAATISAIDSMCGSSYRLPKTNQKQSKIEANFIGQRKLQYQQRSKSTYLVPIDEEQDDDDDDEYDIFNMSLINKHEQDELPVHINHHNSTQSLIINSLTSSPLKHNSSHYQQSSSSSSSILSSLINSSIWNISSSKFDNLRKYRSDSFLTASQNSQNITAINSRHNKKLLKNNQSIQMKLLDDVDNNRIETPDNNNNDEQIINKKRWHQRIIRFRPSSSNLTSLMNKLFRSRLERPSAKSSLLSSSSPLLSSQQPSSSTTTSILH